MKMAEALASARYAVSMSYAHDMPEGAALGSTQVRVA